MADPLSILGGVAAVLQLAEALLKSVQFAKALQDAPKKLIDVLHDVERSTTSMHHVCTVLVPALSGHINPTMSVGLRDTMKALEQCMQEVQTTLQPVVGPGQPTEGNFPQRVLGSFKALNIDKEISDKFQRVNRLNLEVIGQLQAVGIDLQVTFNTIAVQAATGIQNDQTRILDTVQVQHRNLSAEISAQHAATGTQLGAILSTGLETQARTTDVQSTVAGLGGCMHTMQKDYDDFVAAVFGQLNTTTTVLAGISSTSLATQATVTEIRGATVDTDAKVDNIVGNMVLLRELVHEQGQETREHVSRVVRNDLMAYLTGAVDKLSADSQQRVSSLTEDDQLIVQQHAQSQLLRYPGALAAARRAWKPCRCRPIRHVSNSSRLGVWITTETSQDHRSDCPHFHRGTRTKVSSIRMALTPFVNATVELAIGATTGAGGWALAPPLRFRGIVHRSESSLFRIFAETVSLSLDIVQGHCMIKSCKELYGKPFWLNDEVLSWIREFKLTDEQISGCFLSWDIPSATANLARLSARLIKEVERGRASGTDTDERGQTLLFDFVKLFIMLGPQRQAVAQELDTLLETILALGVDLNAKSDGIKTMKSRHTALDYFLHTIHIPKGEIEEPGNGLYLLLDGMARLDLLDYVDLSCTAAYYTARAVSFEVGPYLVMDKSSHLQVVLRHPEMGEALGLDEFEMAIVRRSLSDVERLGSLEHNQPECKKPGPVDILQLALGWDAGLRHLVGRGYPIWTAYSQAHYVLDTVSISILLETPTSIFATGNVYGLASLRTYYMPRSCWKTIFGLVVREHSQRQTSLKELAMRHLTPQDQEQLGLHKDTLLDTTLKLTYKRLQHVTKVPVSLKCCWKSPYIPLTSSSTSFRLITILDTLYQAGFHAVDVCDEKGRTPLFRYMKNGAFTIRESNFCEDLLSELDTVAWFLSRDANCVLTENLNPSNERPTVAFYVAMWLSNGMYPTVGGYFGRAPLRVTLRVALRRIMNMSIDIPLGGHTVSDTCVCFCSTGGCLPCHLLWPHRSDHRLLHGYGNCRDSMYRACLLTPWALAWDVDYDEEELTYSESARLDVFERLGMAHTCCRLAGPHEGKSAYDSGVVSEGEPEDELGEEISRLREEDEDFATQLDSLMAEYHKGRQAHTGTAESFWRVWHQALDQILPPVLWQENCSCLRDEALPAWRAAREREVLVAAGYVGPQYDDDFSEVIRVHFGNRDWNPVLPPEEDDGLFDKDFLDSLRQSSSRRQVSD